MVHILFLVKTCIDPGAERVCYLKNNKILYPLHDAAFQEDAKHGYDAMMSWDGKMKAKINVDYWAIRSHLLFGIETFTICISCSFSY